MSVIAEFQLPPDQFALAHTFDQMTDVTIEVERLATHSREWVMPFLWARNDSMDDFIAVIEDDPSVKEVTPLDIEDDFGHFNIIWDDEVQQFVDKIVDMHGVMLEAEAQPRGWFFKLQFVDQGAFEEFQSYFGEQDVTFDLLRLSQAGAPKDREYDLTPRQREVLSEALDAGYFDVPREIGIEDLAERLDISSNAVSERLRRATANLVRNTLTVEPPRNAV